MIVPVVRRLLRLGPAECGSQIETQWIAMRDGVRLATHHFWPIDGNDPLPTILIRTPYGTHSGRSWIGVVARLIAESGYHVVVQDVRGRYASEGEFVPFANERRDGADSMAWLVDQDWCEGAIGLFGASYLAYTAWCIAAETPSEIGAISSLIGSGDMHGLFYPGGALALSVALEWSLGVGEHEAVPTRHIDLERALAHLPVREADRVGLRTVDWYRDWIDHPRNDDYWQSLHAAIPESPPPSLLIAGWYDFFLSLQLADFAALGEAADESEGVAPRLIVGPWSHGLSARLGWLFHGIGGVALRETVAHFDRHLKGRDGTSAAPAVRYFLAGRDRWQEASQWPPAETESRILHLAPDGGLDWSAPEHADGERSYEYDPAAPTPTRGGALFGLKSGIKNQRDRVHRRDLLVYESPPLETPLTLVGHVILRISMRSDAEDMDLAAKLIDVFPNGRAENVCDGLVRGRWMGVAPDCTEPRFTPKNEVREWTLELGAVGRRLAEGHRIRLEIASANFPRLDRNPGVRDAPGLAAPEAFSRSKQTVVHEPGITAHLELPVLTA